jgi:hypothetical protein
VTEPVARVTSVRRTVTIAGALIASQAVLCAVIGWVTFGGHGDSGGSKARAAEPNLGPALVIPPASVAPVLPSAHHSSHPAATEPTTAATSKPSWKPPRVPTVTSRSPSASPAAPKPPPATGPAKGSVVIKPTPSATEVQGNVVIGDKCDPEGADGVTATDVAVLCVRTAGGDLIWRIK